MFPGLLVYVFFSLKFLREYYSTTNYITDVLATIFMTSRLLCPSVTRCHEFMAQHPERRLVATAWYGAVPGVSQETHHISEPKLGSCELPEILKYEK